MQNSEEIKQRALGAIFHFDMKEAREIAKEIDYRIKKLSESHGNGAGEIAELSALLIRLRLLTLPLLKDEEALRLVKESAAEMINDPDLVLAERIDGRQLTFPKSLRYEMVNQPIMEALHENIERIGEGRIFVTGSKSPELSTIKNWLLDYDRAYGTEPQKDLTWLEYAKKNAISARLNSSQADTLRKLLKLYEWLKREHAIE
ncbi:hypothetical protein KKB43_05210 [Patescibacteria group bacterium]|nr:hypothetical protein [Patescibacteria group bacterium]MBU4580384.1 hypothetical protein [Patescibacteria group bacterium]